jgi:hypothetical protein
MGLIRRVKNLILSPDAEWAVIAEGRPGAARVITGHALPLAAMSAAATIVSWALYHGGIPAGVAIALANLAATVGAVLIAAGFVDMLSPAFASERRPGRALALVVYSFTPVWLGGIFVLLPFGSSLGALVAVYGVYLLYTGLPLMMGTPVEKTGVYLAVAAAIAITAYELLAWGIGKVLGMLFGFAVVDLF